MLMSLLEALEYKDVRLNESTAKLQTQASGSPSDKANLEKSRHSKIQLSLTIEDTLFSREKEDRVRGLDIRRVQPKKCRQGYRWHILSFCVGNNRSFKSSQA